MKKPEPIAHLKSVLANNVRALLGHQGITAVTAELVRRGIANGTVTRILDAKTAIGLDKLAELAACLNVEVWQLLVPGLDPERMPTTEPLAFRWPFSRIDPTAVLGLSGTAALNVENGLLVSLATIGISAGKRQPKIA